MKSMEIVILGGVAVVGLSSGTESGGFSDHCSGTKDRGHDG